MSPAIIHSIILVFTIAFSFVFSKTSFAQYDLQISALLFLILFLGKRFFKDKSRLLESVVFTLIVLIIINSTGGITSDFFFLIYFLLFSLSLLLEPIISITTTLTLVIFYIMSLPENQEIKGLLPIFSLAFLTPFAMFLGQEFKKNYKLRIANSALKKTIISNQEETFLFLSLMLKNHLKSIKHAVENFMGDHQLHQIKKHTREIERLIEKFEKES